MYRLMGRSRAVVAVIGFVVTSALAIHPTVAEEASETELAKQTQNPVANLISLPLQFNFEFDVGPNEETFTVLNVQPVIPVGVGENWNLINRPILPLKDQPAFFLGMDDETGVGDLTYQMFFSPKKPGKLIWGAGPVLVFPTASNDALGSEKWSIGPSVLLLSMPGRWVVGGLISNVWSYAGEDDRADVNFFTFQYFANYNFNKGWYFTSAPIITANWKAGSGQKWTVPFGGGMGKVTHWGKQPVNLSAAVFYNVEKPDHLDDWAARFQIQFLFPKKPKG